MSRPFRHLCPEADLRDAMTDDEFWQHVAMGLTQPPYQETDPDGDYYDGPDLDVQMSTTPCEVCGSTGACGYDQEGRALIHATGEDEG